MEPEEKNNHDEKQASRRYNLAIFIIGPSLIMLIVVSAFMLRYSDIKAETIFTALIGLIGTWVGTILAFYYSKDNFEAASKSTDKLIERVTSSQEKLKSTLAGSVMLVINSFNAYTLEDAQEKIPLDTIKEAFKTYNRLPILDKEGLAKFIIHKSVLTEFIADYYSGDYDSLFNIDAPGQRDASTLTFKQFLTANDFENRVSKSFITAKIDENLDALKVKMEGKELCSDAFITTDGSPTGKVIGWVTNAIILENSQV